MEGGLGGMRGMGGTGGGEDSLRREASGMLLWNSLSQSVWLRRMAAVLSGASNLHADTEREGSDGGVLLGWLGHSLYR